MLYLFIIFLKKNNKNSRYDNHSPPSTTARNGSTEDQDCAERNGSAKKQERDGDTKTENNVSESSNFILVSLFIVI